MIELKCPANILPLFADLAHANTVRGLETLGLLCGKKIQNSYTVTHLVLPDQTNYSHKCEITQLGIDQIYETAREHDIIELGWIHTHPTFDVFMSSVDVHVQFERQRLLPETVAIVINPQDRNGACFGMYNLTDVGLSLLSECTQSASHQHDNITSYYKHASHCTLVQHAQLILVNLSNSLQRGSNRYPSTWTLVHHLTSQQPATSQQRVTQQPATLQQATTSSSAAQCPPVTQQTATQPTQQPVSTSSSTTNRCLAKPAVQGPAQRLGLKRPATSSATTSSATTYQTTTSRPDLGGTRIEFFHEYAQRVEKTGTIKTTRLLLGHCATYINIEEQCSAALGTCTALRNPTINLENALIDAITGDLTTGVCYVATFLVENRYLYTRWIDSNELQGFVEAQQSFIHDGNICPSTDKQIMWQVMTTADLEKRAEWYQSNLRQKRDTLVDTGQYFPATGKRWGKVIADNLHGNQKGVHNSLCLLNSVNTQQSNITLLGTMVHIVKKSHQLSLNPDSKLGYHMQTGIYSSSDVKPKLHHHKLFATSPTPLSFSDHVASFTSAALPLPLLKQQAVVNSLPNDASPQGRGGVRYSCYFSTGDASLTEDRTLLKYIPTSTRNCALYHWRLGNNQQMLKTICGTGIPVRRAAPTLTTRDTGSEQESAVDIDTLPVSAAEPTDVPSNMPDETSSFTSSPYFLFLEQLVGQYGILEWRVNSNISGQICDIIAINDIDLVSGTFLKNSFAHVQRVATGDEILYTCECKMYITCLRLNTTDSPAECFHIKFTKEHVEPMYSLFFPSASHTTSQTEPGKSPLLGKLIQSTKKRNVAVVQLGNSSQFRKFSVVAKNESSCALVTLDKHRFACHNGMCRARKGHKRKVSKLGDGDNCQHLQQLHANGELWKDPNFEQQVNASTSTDGSSDEEDEGDDMEADGDGEPAPGPEPDSSPKYFNPDTAEWTFPSVSTHIPREQTDPVLKERSQQRLAINPLNTDVCEENGYLMLKEGATARPFILCPHLNRDLCCKCGDKYWSEEHPDGIISPRYSFPTNVYLQHGVAKFMVYDRKCIQEQEECVIPYSGHQDALHIYTSYTAAGDEIGWEYVNLVTTSQISITSYCSVLSKRYSVTYPDQSFMSRNTFIGFIFSWLANFKIDFRQPCSTCGFNPPFLACDGTKIGIFFRNSSVIPIEQPTCDEQVTAPHNRTIRQFFCYSIGDTLAVKEEKRQAKTDLGYFVAKYSNTLPKWQEEQRRKKRETSNRNEETRKTHLLSQTPVKCQPLLDKFVNFTLSHGMMSSLCPIFQFLASDSSLTALFNFRFLPLVTSILEGSGTLENLKGEVPEVYNMLIVSRSEGPFEDVREFLQYIVDTIQRLHASDHPVGDSSDVIEVYNPEVTGHSYYFTSHGNRLRHHRNYSIGRSTDQQEETCRKSYYEASKSGSTYLFLWFDPIHGHCYGFHIITTSEGRKDPFASLYTYKEKCPDAVFYDFSCQLEEFCLNREPKFWRDCRFYHDIFHGYSHKCSYAYNSRRVPALHVGVNTQICEQFNSYVQKIKYSARSMNQSHFIFYLQFFIHKWNEMKAQTVRDEERMVRLLLQ